MKTNIKEQLLVVLNNLEMESKGHHLGGDIL